jgi:osmotically-inducible protein OsmY
MNSVRPPRISARLALATIIATIATLALGACASETDDTQSGADDALEARVVAAIANASDLPADAFSVAASDGVVRITGAVACEDCGGMQTPGGIQSIQQSLGAVTRAVPGVERVEFDLEFQSER